MDFFLFNSKNSKIKETNSKETPHSIKIERPANDVSAHVTYQNVSIGTLVRIIRKPNSKLNIYKGYIGEVKHYRKGQEHAIIFLYAIASLKCVQFPLDHFVKFSFASLD